MRDAADGARLYLRDPGVAAGFDAALERLEDMAAVAVARGRHASRPIHVWAATFDAVFVVGPRVAPDAAATIAEVVEPMLRLWSWGELVSDALDRRTTAERYRDDPAHTRRVLRPLHRSAVAAAVRLTRGLVRVSGLEGECPQCGQAARGGALVTPELGRSVSRVVEASLDLAADDVVADTARVLADAFGPGGPGRAEVGTDPLCEVLDRLAARGPLRDQLERALREGPEVLFAPAVEITGL